MASWAELSRVTALASQAGTVRVKQLELIASTELSVSQVLLSVRHGMLVKTPQDVEAAVDDIQSRRAQISRNDDAFLNQLTTPADREAFKNNWLHLQEETWPVADANMKLVREGQNNEAFAMLAQKTIPAFARMQAWLAAERARQGTALAEEIDELARAANAIRTKLAFLAALIAVGLLALSWSIARGLQHRVARSQAVAERVQHGDLTEMVTDDRRDEITPLLYTLAAMQEALTAVVGTVRGNAEAVATASTEIARGNQDLSRRTEEQASSLQQTAASMEELTATVRTNADTALEATRLVDQASAAAVRGGAAVNQVMGTMSAISASSKRVFDIIGVIDGIAFQTNILALNAAVEAARAGEQGRGFAVVASEVRNLAQRSAEAAKEIKVLITDSVQIVEEGNLQVGQAGQTMDDIVQQVTRVNDLIGEIRTATQEQARGIEQVSQAVTQLDAVTQQNAALVEEGSAAAEGLRNQARELVEAVHVFKLRQAAPDGSVASSGRLLRLLPQHG
jgi:methyl-accepting chemotaxis protein